MNAEELSGRGMAMLAEAAANNLPFLVYVIHPNAEGALLMVDRAISFGDKVPENISRLMLGSAGAQLALEMQTSVVLSCREK